MALSPAADRARLIDGDRSPSAFVIRVATSRSHAFASEFAPAGFGPNCTIRNAALSIFGYALMTIPWTSRASAASGFHSVFFARLTAVPPRRWLGPRSVATYGDRLQWQRYAIFD